MENNFEQHLRSLTKFRKTADSRWLKEQRNKLVGVVDQFESKRRKPNLLNIYPERKTPLIQVAASILILAGGVAIGSIFTNYISNNKAYNNTKSIEDLLLNNRITAVQLSFDKDAVNPFQFNLETNKPVEYSGDEHDESVLMLINYMLNNTENPGERLKLAKKLSNTNLQSELSAKVITKAIFEEDNSAIQKTLIESIENNKSKTVRDAVLSIVLGEYDSYLRLSAINLLSHFKGDEYVRKMLKIISVSDENPTIRFVASKIITDNKINLFQQDEIEK